MNPASAQRLLDGKYELLRPIGKGGMGAVHEARHCATGRRVAVKVIAVDQVHPTPTIVQRFAREARATGAIDSPHIAQVLDAGADSTSGEPYLVMELLTGEDLLGAKRQMWCFPPDLALRVAMQACLGLESAHAAGVIHRDVKPANIFLARRDGEIVVKLLDFGIAKITGDLLGHDRARLTASGVVQGSPRYMSPEQALGGRTLDHRTDLWSLGVVLYELLAGVPPHEGSDSAAMLMRICTIPAPPLRDRAPWVSPEMAALVHRALSQDPADRFATAAEMAGALRELLPNGLALAVTMFAPLREEVSDAETLAPVAANSPLAPIAVAPTLLEGTPAPPRAIEPLYPDYLVTEEQGRGGLGRVLRAHDKRLGRTVAVKEMLHDDPAQRTRFLREARLTARLEHPSIVPVYELGFRADGAPFYAMKLVTGERLDVRIQRAGSLNERLALLPSLLAVSEAVAFAHDRRIIHRDLKPANVILGAFGETVVIDWGLAKDLTEPSLGAANAAVVRTGERVEAAQGTPVEVEATVLALSAGSGESRVGHAIGTLAYMPEEQFRGEAVDERADVFALGASLYHLIAGAPPNVDRLVRGATDRSPVAPAFDAREPGVPEELAAIVRKAMERRAEDRYPSAGELATDLRRFQTGQLVGAHRYSLGVLVRRWVVRHRRAVITALASVATLLVLGWIGLARIFRERDRAEAARARADGEHQVAVDARRAAEQRATRLTLLQAEASEDRDPTATIAWLKKYPEDGADWDQLPSIAADAESRGVAKEVLPFDSVIADTIAISPNERYLVAGGTSGQSIRVWDLATGRPIGSYPEDGTIDLAFSPDSSTIAAAGSDGTILLIDPTNGTSHAIRDQKARVESLASAPNGSSFVSCGDDGVIRLRSWTSLDSRDLGKHEGTCESLAWAPDGRRVASTGTDARLRIWSVTTSQSKSFSLSQGGSITQVRWSPDGRYVATGDGAGELRLWDVDAGTSAALAGHHGWIGDIRFTPDGSRLISGGSDTTVRVWDVARKVPLRVLSGHARAVQFLSVSSDGIHVVSSGNEREMRVWNIETGNGTVLGARDRAGNGLFSSSGRFLVAGGEGAVRVWDVRAPPETVLRGHTDVIEVVAWFPDGDRIWTGSADMTVRVWNAKTGAPLAVLGGNGAIVQFGDTLDRAATRLVTGGTDSKVHIWDIPTSKLVRTLDTGATLSTLKTVGDGHSFVTGGEDGLMRFWDATTGESRVLSGHTKEISHIELSPDRTLIVSGSADGTIRLRNFPSGEMRAVLPMDASVARAKFSPNGALVAGSSREGQVRVWDARSGALLRDLQAGRESVWRLQFTPDSKTIVFSGSSGLIRIGNLGTGVVRVIHAHTGLVRGIDISPDGSLIASVGADGTARLWDLATGRLRFLRRSAAFMTRVAFSPDGHSLAVGSWDALVHVYPIDPASLVPLDSHGFRAWLSGLTTAELDVSEQLLSPVVGTEN